MTKQSEYVQHFEPVWQHGGRFADLVRSLSRHEAAQLIPGMEWTAGEVAAHVVSVLRRYAGDKRRARSVAALRVQNAEDVAEDTRDCNALADEIDERIALIAAVAPHLEPSQRFPFHAATEITTNGAWANLIAEFFVRVIATEAGVSTAFGARFSPQLEGGCARRPVRSPNSTSSSSRSEPCSSPSTMVTLRSPTMEPLTTSSLPHLQAPRRSRSTAAG